MSNRKYSPRLLQNKLFYICIKDKLIKTINKISN
jgi:hypothetical protein